MYKLVFQMTQAVLIANQYSRLDWANFSFQDSRVGSIIRNHPFPLQSERVDSQHTRKRELVQFGQEH